MSSRDLAASRHIVERQLRPQQRVVDHGRNLRHSQLPAWWLRVIGWVSGPVSVHNPILSATRNPGATEPTSRLTRLHDPNGELPARAVTVRPFELRATIQGPPPR